MILAVAIPNELRAQIEDHARSAFPAECCGYLVGPRDAAAVDTAIACRNAQADGDHPTVPERGVETGFVIAGAELLAFARTFDSSRPARIVYHSHTNGRAYFSDVDRDVARGAGYPVQHLVVGVTPSGVTGSAQFAWCETTAEFVEIARWSGPVLG
jgi:proteasome lid subunit RPN8/RPN11